VLEVKLILGEPSTRLGVGDGLRAEPVLLVAVVEVVGVLERTAYGEGWIWSIKASIDMN